MSDELKACLNTDREIWRETLDDYYSPSIHVTAGGGIGINVGGHTFVMPVRKWHELAKATFPRNSQNQTVASGVEGAHEGTTADEKGGSREPEKLNNAQNATETSTMVPLLREALSRVAFLRSCILCNEVLSHEEAVDLKEWIDKIKSALAESSLSHCPHFIDGRKKSDCGICTQVP